MTDYRKLSCQLRYYVRIEVIVLKSVSGLSLFTYLLTGVRSFRTFRQDERPIDASYVLYTIPTAIWQSSLK